MKKLACVFLAAVFVFALSACGRAPVGQEKAEPQAADTQTKVSEKVWTKEDVAALYTPEMEADWQMIDCVTMPDFAYDHVGVILGAGWEAPTSYLAFVEADRGFSVCIVHARLADEPELTYLGDGVATFQAEAEDGTLFEQKVTFSQSEDGSATHFDSEGTPKM